MSRLADLTAVELERLLIPADELALLRNIEGIGGCSSDSWMLDSPQARHLIRRGLLNPDRGFCMITDKGRAVLKGRANGTTHRQ
jgi:hypothetical protein